MPQASGIQADSRTGPPNSDLANEEAAARRGWIQAESIRATSNGSVVSAVCGV